jgi:hypothetical protein
MPLQRWAPGDRAVIYVKVLSVDGPMVTVQIGEDERAIVRVVDLMMLSPNDPNHSASPERNSKKSAGAKRRRCKVAVGDLSKTCGQVTEYEDEQYKLPVCFEHRLVLSRMGVTCLDRGVLIGLHQMTRIVPCPSKK